MTRPRIAATRSLATLLAYAPRWTPAPAPFVVAALFPSFNLMPASTARGLRSTTPAAYLSSCVAAAGEEVVACMSWAPRRCACRRSRQGGPGMPVRIAARRRNTADACQRQRSWYSSFRQAKPNGADCVQRCNPAAFNEAGGARGSLNMATGHTGQPGEVLPRGGSRPTLPPKGCLGEVSPVIHLLVAAYCAAEVGSGPVFPGTTAQGRMGALR